MARDTERQRTYDVEFQLRTILDRQHECPTFKIAGSTITIPAEHRFADLHSIQRYVEMIAPGVKVRERASSSHAHYERHTNTIAIPVIRTSDKRTPWAMRAIVVLHEIAHHLTSSGVPSHGSEFRENFTDLVGKYIGPEVGFLLHVMFKQEGL